MCPPRGVSAARRFSFVAVRIRLYVAAILPPHHSGDVDHVIASFRLPRRVAGLLRIKPVVRIFDGRLPRDRIHYLFPITNLRGACAWRRAGGVPQVTTAVMKLLRLAFPPPTGEGVYSVIVSIRRLAAGRGQRGKSGA
ncbi:MAG: hypothetical protein ABI580_01835 [Burkholderiaceae bacterium]